MGVNRLRGHLCSWRTWAHEGVPEALPLYHWSKFRICWNSNDCSRHIQVIISLKTKMNSNILLPQLINQCLFIYVIIRKSLRIIPGEGPNCSSSVTMSFLVPGYLQVQLLVDTITFRYNDMWVELHGILIWFCNILFGHEHKYNDITTITWMLRTWFFGQKGLDRKLIRQGVW